MSAESLMVRVFFSLECHDDWPPVSVESVWATSVGAPDRYMIQNTPFFAQSATLGDIVVAERRPGSTESEAGELWFHERVSWRGNALIRLIFRKDEAKDEIVAWLERAGCVCEGLTRFAMVALSISRAVDQSIVQQYLLQHEQLGHIYIEEAILR